MDLYHFIAEIVTNSTVTTALTNSQSVAPDPALVAAIVSAIVALAVLGIDRLFIEPARWRSRELFRELETELHIHGWLVSVLMACQQKIERLPQTERRLSHLLESDDIRKLEDIFEKNAYAISQGLRQTWYDVQKGDTTFLLDRVKHRDPSQLGKYNVIQLDLAEMQKKAEQQHSFIHEARLELLRLGALASLRGLERLLEKKAREVGIRPWAETWEQAMHRRE